VLSRRLKSPKQLYSLQVSALELFTLSLAIVLHHTPPPHDNIFHSMEAHTAHTNRQFTSRIPSIETRQQDQIQNVLSGGSPPTKSLRSSFKVGGTFRVMVVVMVVLGKVFSGA